MGIISCGTTLIDQGLYQGLTSVDWDTTPKTATFTGVAGNGYFCNTSSGTFTLNLPAGSVGDIIAVSDYASTFNVVEIPAVYSNPESTLGTPDFAVAGVNNFSAPSAPERELDLYSAVDVGNFDASDYGVVWEVGGAAQGFAASLEAGGQLWVAAYDGDPWANPDMAYLKVDVSSYYNTPGTFYTTIDMSSKQFNLYFQPGGPTGGNQAISLGTSTAGTTNFWSGNNAGALGQVNGGMVNFGFTNYNAAFTGDALELRWYYDTAEPSPFQSITTPAVSDKSLTISPNGTDKINGTNDDYFATTKGVSLVLLYIDSTRGWKVIGGGEINASGENFITATGGTVTTDGDFKIHTFTGPGTFSVSLVGNAAGGGDIVSYAVVAGGGGSGKACASGGGGAGGYREGKDSPKDSYTASPLVAPAGLTVSASPGSYPITVGAGGAAAGGPNTPGSNGSPSTFSSITSAGGGFGAGGPPNGGPGGSGGGGGGFPARLGGTGNTPPVSPAQGTNGGTGFWTGGPRGEKGGGGGGATDAGTTGGPGPAGTAPGGDGATSSINGSSTTRAGGGGGGNAGATPAASSGGAGGGGPGGCGVGGPGNGTPGTTNTGGGGGGSAGTPDGGSSSASTGGSGIVIIRYKFQ
jgi:hypothetical protein